MEPSSTLKEGFTALAIGVIALSAQVLRYRRVLKPVQRQQVKWILGGMGLSTLTLFVYFTTFAINRAIGFIAALLVSAVVFAAAILLLDSLISLSGKLLISTALAVVVFIPLRPAIQRLIDTRVYGLRQPVSAYEPITPPKPPVSKLQQRCIPVNDVFGIINDLVDALEHIHDKGIIHRDLKPGNIMLNLDAAGKPTRAVLLDFGIARIVEMSITQTGMGNVGTVEYIAPEQILSSRTVTQAADIYSLGVIVYEMLTGERPFKGNAGQVLFGHLKQPAPDPRDIVPEIPMEVSFAVRRAMAKEPEDRYDSARAFAAALHDTESATSANIRLY